jgi:hypothetical protein
LCAPGHIASAIHGVLEYIRFSRLDLYRAFR